MGNKCKFCVTFMGNIKRVAGVLQGSGCGCGRCNGHFTNKKEIDLAITYYRNEVEALNKLKDSINDSIKSVKNNIEELSRLEPIQL